MKVSALILNLYFQIFKNVISYLYNQAVVVIVVVINVDVARADGVQFAVVRFPLLLLLLVH
jgi:hypothetical protein